MAKQTEEDYDYSFGERKTGRGDPSSKIDISTGTDNDGGARGCLTHS